MCQTISDRLACKRRVFTGQLLKIFYRKQLHLFLWIRTRNSWFIETYDSFSLVTFPIEVLDSNQYSRKMQKSYTTVEQDGFFQTRPVWLYTPQLLLWFVMELQTRGCIVIWYITITVKELIHRVYIENLFWKMTWKYMFSWLWNLSVPNVFISK